MELSRRAFLGGALSFACAGRLCGAVSSVPRVRFGFLSDVHLNEAVPARLAAFEKALVRFACANVDAVVCAGDLLDTGTAEEMELVLASWRTAFPGGRAGDGRPVTPFFVWGNHDYMDSSAMRKLTAEELAAAYPHQMRAEKDRWWRELTGEAFPGEVFHRKIRGVSFVGAHWGHEDETGPWMTAHAAEIDTAHPFVHVEHPHPAQTVCGDASGPTAVRDYLAGLPTCLSLSGHSHYSLAGKDAYWRGSFTALTGSVATSHSCLVEVFDDRFEIAPYDESADRAMPTWVADNLVAGASSRSVAVTLRTATGSARATALATSFDARDRRVAASAGRVFTSVRAPGTQVLVR